MADAEDDVLELNQEAGDTAELDQDHEAQPQPEGEEEGLDFSFGDEAAPASGERDTALVRHLREQIRERDKRLAAQGQQQPQQIEVGEMPTLESCDWDEEKQAREMAAWVERNRQAEQVQNQQGEAARKAQEEWAKDHQRYLTRRQELVTKAPDAEEAEAIAQASLSETHQAVIVRVADNAAQLMVALGRHPGKLQELSQITDPLKLAAAVARLEGGLKVMPKRKAIDPDTPARGSAPLAKGSDKELERLEKEASRNGGDRSAVIAYKARLKKQAA